MAAMIEKFQFENLVMNRIPFLLLNYGGDLKGLFPAFHQSHLESLSLALEAERTLDLLRERRLAKEGALVLVCADGLVSESWGRRLEQEGYFNVYVLKNGARGLREPERP